MIALWSVALTLMASAGEAPRIAIVVGANSAPDKELAPLKFPDDDALNFARLFWRLDIDTVVVARPDADTAPLHPETSILAKEGRLFLPTRAGFEKALALVRDKVAAYLQQGEQPEVIFAYAGHGNTKSGVGYITLEDGRLTGRDLEYELVSRMGAAKTHLIIDACYSVFLAYHRGAGGKRRPATGFSQMQGLLQNPRVGLLLSTSATNLTHEWERFGAGVFGHLVRSALYGAADANADNLIDYREIAAFVESATASVPNKRYRPSVFAKAPVGQGRLVAIRPQPGKLILGAPLKGRFLIESVSGVRLIDLSVGPNPVEVLRPSPGEKLFVRSWSGETEYEVGSDVTGGEVAFLGSRPVALASRGAAETALADLLSVPFTADSVKRYEFMGADLLLAQDIPSDPIPTWRLASGWGAIAVGAVAASLSVVFALNARETKNGFDPQGSNLDAVAANASISRQNLRAGVSAGVSAASIGAGIGLLLWPTSAPQTGLSGSEP